jgi:hypothetical protein
VIGVKTSVSVTVPEGVPMPLGTVVVTEMLRETVPTPVAVLATVVGVSDALIAVPALVTVSVDDGAGVVATDFPLGKL